MKFLKLDYIEKKKADVPIYYRNEYTAQAHFLKRIDHSEITLHLEFIVETLPTGGKDISITHVDEVDHPSLPIRRSIIKEIEKLESAGKLHL